MSRYHALVLVPGGRPEDEACDVALELLYPYMITAGEAGPYGKFDYALSPEDVADVGDAAARNVWRAGEITARLAELEVEAILTPDGSWHEPEVGQVWDEGPWLAKMREVLRRHPGCLAMRYVLHT
jgi:hypothetical protein